MKKQICMMMAAMMAAALTGCSGGRKGRQQQLPRQRQRRQLPLQQRRRDFSRGDHRSPGRRIHRDSGCGGGQP